MDQESDEQSVRFILVQSKLSTSSKLKFLNIQFHLCFSFNSYLLFIIKFIIVINMMLKISRIINLNIDTLSTQNKIFEPQLFLSNYLAWILICSKRFEQFNFDSGSVIINGRPMISLLSDERKSHIVLWSFAWNFWHCLSKIEKFSIKQKIY